LEAQIEIENQKVISSELFIQKVLTKKKIFNVSVTGKVVITDSILTHFLKIEIVDCKFLDEVDLVTNKIKIIFFLRCEFGKRLLLSGKSFSHINILQCKFQKYFTFNSLISKKIEINECVIENNIITQLQNFSSDSFVFTKNECSNDILIKPEKLKNLVLEGSEKNYLITYSGLDIQEPLKQLLLFTFSNYRTDYLLRSFEADKFQLIGEIKDSILNINNCKINQGIMHRFVNLGVMFFDRISPLSETSVLIIKNSLLGKAQINNTNFSNFHKVILDSSSIIELIPVNVLWCSQKNLTSDDSYSLKENYRQLKIIAIKNEDIDTKLFFHKLEMHSLQKMQNIKSDFNNKFILKTNHLSNDFGLNWLRSLGWLISISIFFYTTIKFILGYNHFNPSLILEEMGRFLIFINPIYQFDKVFNIDPMVENTNGSLFLDGLSKIIGAYLIYQFISSFRKYSRK
jgi:hypothetical protein